jgi:hypothetical protein
MLSVLVALCIKEAVSSLLEKSEDALARVTRPTLSSVLASTLIARPSGRNSKLSLMGASLGTARDHNFFDRKVAAKEWPCRDALSYAAVFQVPRVSANNCQRADTSL